MKEEEISLALFAAAEAKAALASQNCTRTFYCLGFSPALFPSLVFFFAATSLSLRSPEQVQVQEP